MVIISRFNGPWMFLSNFYLSPLIWENVEYPTGEHAYNAAKTLDLAARTRIAYVQTPHQAKKLGRLRGLRPGWDTSVRYEAMREVLWAKFTCHPGRVAALLSTGGAYLVEGNSWHDQHWGNCTCGRPLCSEPGANHLGRLLMELRTTLESR